MGVEERNASVTSFRADIPGYYDISFTTNTRPLTNAEDLYREWAEYRLQLMKTEIERTPDLIRNGKISVEDFRKFGRYQATYMQQTYRQMIPEHRHQVTSERLLRQEYHQAGAIWKKIQGNCQFDEFLTSVIEDEGTWEPGRDFDGDLALSRFALKLGETLQGQLGRGFPSKVNWRRYSLGDELLRQGQMQLFFEWIVQYSFSKFM